MKWFFRPQEPGEITRDPIIGEFFSTEAIDNPAEALVREGIQNALDAKIGQEVRVRLFLATEDHAPAASQISRWFDGAWNHLYSKGNGLREVPDKDDSCPYLVFEDFGTTGLQGDVSQPFDVPKNNNTFFYFFRAEGRSGKSEGDRGRWGIGKHVFPRSSRISTYFGFTVRADDGDHLLMGHTILKSHNMIGNNYAPDGYFGEQSKGSILMLPITDTKTLNHFCKDFTLSRDNQPGLSIVVPYIDPEITVQDIKQAVISDYFYPILKGELFVEIDTLNQKHRINAKSLLKETASLDGSAKDNIIPLVGFADWVAFRSIGKEYVLKPCTLDAPTWSDDLIPQELIGNMRNDLDNGKNLAFHVGIRVHEKEKRPVISYFNVYLCQDGYKSGRPIFIREGIIISDIHAPRSPGVRSLVIVDDKPLATLLGDSENPAHTQWQKDSSNFKNKYANGKNYIEFVTRIVSNLVNALGAREKQEDPYLFADIFSLPLESMEDQPIEPFDVSRPKTGGKSGIEPIKITPHEKYFQITKILGGFKVVPGDVEIKLPFRLNVQMAYDLRRGNPIKKYNTSDFKLESSPINYKDSQRGITIINAEKNHILVEIINPEFQLVVTGFDDKRDLIVNTQVDEVQND